ncbi:MAG: type II CAAX prenyl endopeptidase Rce1 family protein [Promethearchaeota archaeon]
MSEENKIKIKYCVYCGSEVEENKTYCPKCGKLIIKVKTDKTITKPKPIQRLEIERKCPGCGSLITSTILEQCPICNTELEKIPDIKKTVIQKKPGLIFTSKKLEPEQKFILKKDTWNLKEGINVFGTCIYVLVIVFFLLFTVISFQLDTTTLSIQEVLLSQVPELVFGIYPIWYIYNKKHSFSKIGIFTQSKKILLGIAVGILGGIILILINYMSDSIINFFSNIGWDFFNVRSSILEQNQVIRDSDFLWIILLITALCIGAFSSEIVFRGVLHNTLKQKFKNDFYVVLLVALTYSLVMLLFTFPVGMSFFIANFLIFMVLGIIFELTNGNLSATIFANIFYNVVIMILIYLNL